MIWLAWRQFRTQALIAGAFLLAVAIAFPVTGPHLSHLYATTVTPCAKRGDCSAVTNVFTLQDRLLQQLSIVVVIVPGLIGVFWGAPLIARELETGTYRLAWTQGVTRSKWIVVKLVLVGVASMVVAGLFSLMVTWWSIPFDRLNYGGIFGPNFQQRDIVPIGYAAFAFALGVALGVVIRRTLPAMAATLIGFVAVRMVFTEDIRAHLMRPLRRIVPFQILGNSGPGPASLNPNDWIVTDQEINPAGHVVGLPNGNINFEPTNSGGIMLQGVGRCPNKFPVGGFGTKQINNGQPSQALQHATQDCLNSFHLRQILTYQPASRYWDFQWYEMGIFIALALVLATFSWWWMRRRVA